MGVARGTISVPVDEFSGFLFVVNVYNEASLGILGTEVLEGGVCVNADMVDGSSKWR